MSNSEITNRLREVRELEASLGLAREALDRALLADPRDPTILSRETGLTRQTIYKSRERARLEARPVEEQMAESERLERAASNALEARQPAHSAATETAARRGDEIPRGARKSGAGARRI